jgi:hypothetical protein
MLMITDELTTAVETSGIKSSIYKCRDLPMILSSTPQLKVKISADFDHDTGSVISE